MASRGVCGKTPVGVGAVVPVSYGRFPFRGVGKSLTEPRRASVASATPIAPCEAAWEPDVRSEVADGVRQ